MPQFRTVLAIDSAMNGCGAAVYCSDDEHEPQPCVSDVSPMIRGQAEALVPMVQNVIRAARKEFADIDLICTTIGPGTFTGLRVGMSAARSFALALDVPVIGVSTLDVLAAAFFEAQPDIMAQGDTLWVLIETKRSDYYAGLYDISGAPLADPVALEAQEISARLDESCTGQVFMIGDAAERFMSAQEEYRHGRITLHEGYNQPAPLVLARVGLERSCDPAFDANKGVEPLYLRGADVSQPKTPSRILADL